MSNQNVPEGYLFSRSYTNYLFILLWFLYFFDYVDRMAVVSVFPFLKSDWGLSDAQCGAMVSAVYWAIVLFSFPVSILVDRWSRKKSIGIMAVLWSLATAACAITKNFSHLFVARAAIGLGEAGYAPGGTAMISSIYPKKRRASMVGIWNSSIPLGMTVGIIIGGVIASRWGWRHVFGLVALPGFFVAILFFFSRDYKTVQLNRTTETDENYRTDNHTGRMTKMEIAKSFLSTPSLIFTYLGFAGMMFTSISMSTFLPTYFQRVQGFPLQKATLLASGIMLTSIVASPLGGWLSDLWMKKRADARLLLPAISAVLTTVFFVTGFSFLKTGLFQYAIFLMAGVFSIAWASSAISVTQDVVHPGLRAVSYSLSVVVQNLLGSSLGPVVTGKLSDLYGIKPALMATSLVAISAFLFFYLGSRYYEQDLNNVINVSLEPENNERQDIR